MGKIFLQFAELQWTRVLLAGLLALGLYWVMGFDNGKLLQSEFSSAKQQLAEAEKTLNATKEAMANADNFEREVKETVDQFNRVVPEIMPDKMSTAELTTLASDMSNKSSVKLVKTEPRPATDKSDFYDTTRIAMSVEGTFPQLVMFLSYLSRVPKLMTFDHIDVGVAEGNKDLESPRLIMNGLLTGYRYVRPSAAAAKKPGDAKPGDANAK